MSSDKILGGQDATCPLGATEALTTCAVLECCCNKTQEWASGSLSF